MDAHQNNKTGFALLMFAMVFVLLFFVYITFFHEHSSPDYVNNLKVQAEQNVAPTAPAAPAVADNEPWVPTPEKLKKGEALFTSTCSLCHGPKGLGDGPAGAALVPKPRNFVEGKWRYGGTPFILFNTVTKGSPGTSMAPYGHLPEDERWGVVHYIRSLSQNAQPPTDAEIKAYKASHNLK